MKKFAAVLLVALLLIAALFGLKSCGKGGNGNGEGTGIPANDSSASESDSTDISSAVEIRIEENKIYFDGELCTDENDLKDKIINRSEKEYIFVHNKAIKATYDKVHAVLSELEKALDITISDG